MSFTAFIILSGFVLADLKCEMANKKNKTAGESEDGSWSL